MPLGFLGTSFVLGVVVVVLCPWMCRTMANFVSFSIAQLARAVMLVNLLHEAPPCVLQLRVHSTQ